MIRGQGGRGMDLEELEAIARRELQGARPARLDLRPGEDEASAGRLQVPAEADRDRRVLRPEQPAGVGPRHAPARDRPRHRRPRRQARPEVEGRRHPARRHAPLLRDLPAGGRGARRLAGVLPGLPEDRPPLPATEEPDRLPLQVRGPLAADVRVRGRPGPQARRADDRPGVGPMGGECAGCGTVHLRVRRPKAGVWRCKCPHRCELAWRPRSR